MPFAIAAGIGTAGSLASGFLSSGAASKAAAAQQRGEQEALAVDQQQFGIARDALNPFVQGGTNSFNALQKLLGIGPGGGGPTNPMLQMLGIGPNGQPTGAGIDPSTFQASPGYQFQLQQGQEAVMNSNARTGIGGNALKALQGWGQQTANQGWDQYLKNLGGAWNNLTGDLSNMSGLGLNAAGTLAGDALKSGQLQGADITGAANANAAGIIGANNALVKGIGGAAGNLAGYFNGLPTDQAAAGGGTYGNPDQGYLTPGSQYLAQPYNAMNAPFDWSQVYPAGGLT